MSTIELRNLLIQKIQLTDNNQLLEEASRLLEIGIEESEGYILNDKQKVAIEEARRQILKGEYITDEESNKEIDEWLSE